MFVCGADDGEVKVDVVLVAADSPDDRSALSSRVLVS